MKLPRFFWPFQPGGEMPRSVELSRESVFAPPFAELFPDFPRSYQPGHGVEFTSTEGTDGVFFVTTLLRCGEERRIAARRRLALALVRRRMESEWWGRHAPRSEGCWSVGAIPERESSRAEILAAMNAHIDLSQNAPLNSFQA